MKQLSYSDRANLIESLDSLSKEWPGTEEQLISDSGNWTRNLIPKFGFEQGLVRDIAVLSRFLQEKREISDLAIIARGALIHILGSERRKKSRLKDFGLLDAAFIGSYAVHEINTRLGLKSIYNPPKLTSSEQRLSENLFLDFINTPFLNGVCLVTEQNRAVLSKAIKVEFPNRVMDVIVCDPVLL